MRPAHPSTIWLCLYATSQLFFFFKNAQILRQMESSNISNFSRKGIRYNHEEESKPTIKSNHPNGGPIFFDEVNNRSTTTTTITAAEEPIRLPPKYLGFLRIQKTGSTSVLDFMNNAFPHSHNLFRFYENETVSAWPEHINHCFFAYDDDSGVSAKERKLTDKDFPRYISCPHRRLKFMRRYFLSASNWLHPNHRATLPELQMFTIVREPWDRMVSFFNFLVQIHPDWKAYLTDAQNGCVVAKNLTCFVTQLHKEGGGALDGVDMQFKLLTKNYHRAMTLITPESEGGLAPVFTLINECLEASLYVLVEKFPQIFTHTNITETVEIRQERSRYVVDNYLKKQSATLNIGKREKPKETTELQRLRKKARLWFADDYAFYTNAVDQFLKYLDESNVDEKLVRTCREKVKKY